LVVGATAVEAWVVEEGEKGTGAEVEVREVARGEGRGGGSVVVRGAVEAWVVERREDHEVE